MKTFKVLQFNMQFGQGWDDAYPEHAPVNLDLTIGEILRHKADIVLLQEVEQAQPGGLQTDPPPNFTRLRAALDGYQGFFSYPKADPRELPFGIGLAIFSKTPLRDTHASRSALAAGRIRFSWREDERPPTGF